jgi:hypothetical protein
MSRANSAQHFALCVTLSTALVTSGCTSFGSKIVARDQSSYVVALSEAQKKQLFTNLVRIRYGEPASFVTLDQIVQGYTLRKAAGVGVDLGVLPNEGPVLSGNVSYEDRPTMTFSPVQGRNYLDSFLVPVTPNNVFAAIEIGWPPDLVLKLTVQSINGISNAVISGDRLSNADPRFVRIARLMQDLIVGGIIDLSSVKGKTKNSTTVFLVRNPDRQSSEDVTMLKEFLRLLGLSPRTKRIVINYGRTRPLNRGTLNIQTRSYLQILYAVAATINVPDGDVSSGRTRKTVVDDPLAGRSTVEVRSSTNAPANSHVKAKYNGRWFWIDDSDFDSKRAFSLLLIILTLSERNASQPPPVLAVRG